MKRLVNILIQILVLFGCTSTNKDVEIKRDEALIINEFGKMMNDKLPTDRSISGAIVKGNKIIWSKAYGISSLESQAVADTTTIYRIGSISKSFTAFLLMLLVQDGVINLEDPVERYLPEIVGLRGYSDDTRITFQQLATHRSGLAREPALSDAAMGPIEQWENKVLESIPTTSFNAKPGEKFGYSNIGYGILGLALSRAAKKPFTTLVEERIFKPLQMRSSYFIVPEECRPYLSAGMQDLPDGQTDMKTPLEEHGGRGYKVPNGGIYSTPNDLARFMICNMGLSYSLLKNENRALMQNKVVTIGENNHYGVGYFINQEDSATIINHSGAVAGYTATFAFDKGSGYGVVLMRNYVDGEPDIWRLPFELLAALSKVEDN
jgi:CubicO group peptidase (beta-lactamase class C family)